VPQIWGPKAPERATFGHAWCKVITRTGQSQEISNPYDKIDYLVPKEPHHINISSKHELKLLESSLNSNSFVLSLRLKF
jgi:hypothetical protein